MGRSIDSPIVCFSRTGMLCWIFQAIYYQDSTVPANHVDCTSSQCDGMVGKRKLRPQIWSNAPEASHGSSDRSHVRTHVVAGVFRGVDNTSGTQCLEPSKILIPVCILVLIEWSSIHSFGFQSSDIVH